MSRNVSLWMPAVYVYIGCCWLCYFYMSLVYGEYLVNVHFSDIPHTFIPHFTLYSAEKIRIEFSANYPLRTFRIPQSAFRKIPLPSTYCGTVLVTAESRCIRNQVTDVLRNRLTGGEWIRNNCYISNSNFHKYLSIMRHQHIQLLPILFT